MGGEKCEKETVKKKSVLALSLCGAMLLSDTCPPVEAWEKNRLKKKRWSQTLLGCFGQYPEGAFTIGEPQLTGTEGEDGTDVLRQGARDQEAAFRSKRWMYPPSTARSTDRQ